MGPKRAHRRPDADLRVPRRALRPPGSPRSHPPRWAQLFLDEGTWPGCAATSPSANRPRTGWFAYPGSPPRTRWPSRPRDPPPGPGSAPPGTTNYGGPRRLPRSTSTCACRHPSSGCGPRSSHLRNSAGPERDQHTFGAPFVAAPGTAPPGFDQFSEKGQGTPLGRPEADGPCRALTYGQTILDIYNSMRAYAGRPVSVSGGVGADSALTNQELWGATTTVRH